MKLVLISCALIGFAYGANQEFLDQAMGRMEKTVEECVAETSISEEDLATLGDQNIPSSKIGKCFIACYHKKFGIVAGLLDRDGSMSAMKYLKDGDPELYEKAVKIFETCLTEVPNEECECETAANFMVCFNNIEIEMGLQPGMVPL